MNLVVNVLKLLLCGVIMSISVIGISEGTSVKANPYTELNDQLDTRLEAFFDLLSEYSDKTKISVFNKIVDKLDELKDKTNSEEKIYIINYLIERINDRSTELIVGILDIGAVDDQVSISINKQELGKNRYYLTVDTDISDNKISKYIWYKNGEIISEDKNKVTINIIQDVDIRLYIITNDGKSYSKKISINYDESEIDEYIGRATIRIVSKSNNTYFLKAYSNLQENKIKSYVWVVDGKIIKDYDDNVTITTSKNSKVKVAIYDTSYNKYTDEIELEYQGNTISSSHFEIITEKLGENRYNFGIDVASMTSGIERVERYVNGIMKGKDYGINDSIEIEIRNDSYVVAKVIKENGSVFSVDRYIEKEERGEEIIEGGEIKLIAEREEGDRYEVSIRTELEETEVKKIRWYIDGEEVWFKNDLKRSMRININKDTVIMVKLTKTDNILISDEITLYKGGEKDISNYYLTMSMNYDGEYYELTANTNCPENRIESYEWIINGDNIKKTISDNNKIRVKITKNTEVKINLNTKDKKVITTTQYIRYEDRSEEGEKNVNIVNGMGIDACNNQIREQLGSTSNYRCTIGGGCSITGDFPSRTYPSANPRLAGACIPESIRYSGGGGEDSNNYVTLKYQLDEKNDQVLFNFDTNVSYGDIEKIEWIKNGQNLNLKTRNAGLRTAGIENNVEMRVVITTYDGEVLEDEINYIYGDNGDGQGDSDLPENGEYECEYTYVDGYRLGLAYIGDIVGKTKIFDINGGRKIYSQDFKCDGVSENKGWIKYGNEEISIQCNSGYTKSGNRCEQEISGTPPKVTFEEKYISENQREISATCTRVSPYEIEDVIWRIDGTMEKKTDNLNEPIVVYGEGINRTVSIIIETERFGLIKSSYNIDFGVEGSGNNNDEDFQVNLEYTYEGLNALGQRKYNVYIETSLSTNEIDKVQWYFDGVESISINADDKVLQTPLYKDAIVRVRVYNKNGKFEEATKDVNYDALDNPSDFGYPCEPKDIDGYSIEGGYQGESKTRMKLKQNISNGRIMYKQEFRCDSSTSGWYKRGEESTVVICNDGYTKNGNTCLLNSGNSNIGTSSEGEKQKCLVYKDNNVIDSWLRTRSDCQSECNSADKSYTCKWGTTVLREGSSSGGGTSGGSCTIYRERTGDVSESSKDSYLLCKGVTEIDENVCGPNGSRCSVKKKEKLNNGQYRIYCELNKPGTYNEVGVCE